MRLLLVVIVAIASATACRPSDVLSVPPPAGVTAAGALANQTGAEAEYTNARFQLYNAVAGAIDYVPSGVLMWSELLTDEFSFSGFTQFAYYANVDARETTTGGGGSAAGEIIGGGFSEGGDGGWQGLLNARSVLLLAVPELAQYEPPTGQSKVGEAYALVGYAELLLAEDYCAGTPLDQVLAAGGVQYGTPLTTDSLLGVAMSHFDSALAHTNGDAAVEGLASVGLGRTLLDRGQYAAAAAAAANVPLSFVYNTELAPSWMAGQSNLYAYAYSYPYTPYRFFNVSDVEGENGLNYRSALDPRLTFDSSLTTTDGGKWYLPTKFEVNFAYVPLATGVEAALIGAEAALQSGDVGDWSAGLNALRANAPGTYLQLDTAMAPLTADSTTTASAAEQVSVMFRERAFWLFGTGTRLGDLRRLVRQYGRDQGAVYPTGPYANGSNPNLPTPIPNYGMDVDLTLPTPASGTTITNPNYRGCNASTKTA